MAGSAGAQKAKDTIKVTIQEGFPALDPYNYPSNEAGQWSREHRAHGNRMQNAEGDEGLREREIARDADQDRAAGDERDPPPECVRSRMRAPGEREAHAHQRLAVKS